MVLSSTGLRNLTSNGTNGPWSLYGLDALNAAHNLEVQLTETAFVCIEKELIGPDLQWQALCSSQSFGIH